MTRKKTSALPSYSKIVPVRFTEEGYKILSERSRRAGSTISEFIRKAALGRPLRAQYVITYDSPELLEAMRNLGRISSSLNQIAKHLNSGDPYTEAVKEMMLECAAEMLSLRDDVRKVIGEYHGNH